MSELDAEFEKLREEARRRLDADKDLAARIEPDPQVELPKPELPRLVAPKPAVERPREPDAAFDAAARAAHAAEKKVSALSTGKVALAVGGLILALILLNKIIGPLIALVILAGIIVLLIRFVSWFRGGKAASGEVGDAADDDEDDEKDEDD